MFQSFFPQPKLFFSSLAIWSGLLILVWYSFGKKIGESIGFDLSETETVIGLVILLHRKFALAFTTGSIFFCMALAKSTRVADLVSFGLSTADFLVIRISSGFSGN